MDFETKLFLIIGVLDCMVLFFYGLSKGARSLDDFITLFMGGKL